MARDKGRGEKKREKIDYSLQLHPEVENDLQQAFEYYEKQSTGLGDEFLLSVDASIHYIQRHPFHFQKINKHTLRANTKKFPFGIFYFVKAQQIFITAILHLKRNPKIWKKRKLN